MFGRSRFERYGAGAGPAAAGKRTRRLAGAVVFPLSEVAVYTRRSGVRDNAVPLDFNPGRGRLGNPAPPLATAGACCGLHDYVKARPHSA